MDPITSEKVMPYVVNALNALTNANRYDSWEAVGEAEDELWTAIKNAATLGDPSAIDLCQTFEVAYDLEF